MDTPTRALPAVRPAPRQGTVRLLQAGITYYARGVNAIARTAGPLLDLYIRLWLAQTFLVSGLLKVANWDNALALARYEYPVSWIDPVSAAWLGAGIELVAPPLLILGLATRATALALGTLALVIQFNYQVLDTHLLWAALLGWLAVRGAGPLSMDRLIARGLADSAVPFARPLLAALAALTRYGEPVYVLLLRLWLAASLAVMALPHALTSPALLISATLAPLALPGVALAGAVLLATGVLMRPLALTLALLLLGMEFMDLLRIDTTHAVVVLLLALVLSGARTFSVDALLQRWLQRTVPELSGRPAFSLQDLPRVVIVGAGFGGIACARALRHVPVAITLVDRHNYHLFQPLLYQVATTALSPGDIAMPIRTLLREQFNARALLGEVTGIDTQRREVLTDTGAIPYDYLVLATGASHSYFGHDEWAPHAPGLKRIEDATAVRSRLLRAFERAEATTDPDERTALLTFLIVGAGPTGVELAGAIAELARFGMERDFRSVDPATARVILVQAGERILPALPERLSRQATAALQRLGIEVLVNHRVEAIDADGVHVGGRRIAARTVFWAAGVIASPAARWLDVPADRSGRVTVQPDLSVRGLPDIFVIGDTADSTAWQGRQVPGIGPAAKQGGHYAARVIRARVLGRMAPAPFRYRHLGSLATIGRKAAVADFGLVRLSGAPAWWLWGLVHVYFLAGLRNRVSVLLDWAWAYFTFRSSTRLILEESAPVAAKSIRDTELEVRHG